MRATANAHITFGLVTFPVKVYTAHSSDKKVSFRQVCTCCNAAVKQKLTCGACGDEDPNIVKGYEFAKGQFVTFTADEIKELQQESTKAIEVHEFVKETQIDPKYISKAYYLGTDKIGSRAYALLLEALKVTKKVALAQFSIRGQQYLVSIRATDKGLVMHELVYEENLRDQSKVPMAELQVDANELEMAKDLIKSMSSRKLNIQKYTDNVQARVQQAVDARVAGKEPEAPKIAPVQNVGDLMATLKASLAAKGIN